MAIIAELWHYRYSDDHLLREAIMANNYSQYLLGLGLGLGSFL